MANFCKIIIVGNLSKDPVFSVFDRKDGQGTVNRVEFSIAYKEHYNSKQSTFVTCRMLGDRAEYIHKYVSKGDSILIEGVLALETWVTPDNIKKSMHIVKVSNFEFMGKSNNSNAEQYQESLNHSSNNDDLGRGSRADQLETFPLM